MTKFIKKMFPLLLLFTYIMISGCRKIELSREVHFSSIQSTFISHNQIETSTCIGDKGVGLKEFGQCWSQETNPTLNDSSILGKSINSSGIYNTKITTLNSNATYFVKAYAIDNNNEIYYSDQIICKTLSPTSPILGKSVVLSLTENLAVIRGEVISFGENNDSLYQHGHCWSINEIPTVDDNKTLLGGLKDSLHFVSELSQLMPYKKYYLRSYAKNSIGDISYGYETTFRMKAALPVISFKFKPNSTKSTTAQGQITIIDNGGCEETTIGFCYDTIPSPDKNAKVSWNFYTYSELPENTSILKIEHLSANTKYYAKAFAENIAGITYSEEISFTTKPPVLPRLSSWQPKLGYNNLLTFSIAFLDQGGEPLSAFGACWNNQPSPTINDNIISSPLSQEYGANIIISDLVPGSIYYLRAFATNSIGTVYGTEFQVVIPEIPFATRFVCSYIREMGSVNKSNSNPIHKIAIDSFFIGNYEITNSQYCIFLENYTSKNGNEDVNSFIDIDKNPEINYNGTYSPVSGKESFPVRYVTWNGAAEFAKYVGGRLPTEAEWEFTASGWVWKWDGYTYSESNDIETVAWYNNNSANIHEVGQKISGMTELYDMSGNVREWCSDWYDPDYYSVSPQENPQGPATGTYKVVRGGSYLTGEEKCRVYTRDYASPDTCAADIGFRVVIPLD